RFREMPLGLVEPAREDLDQGAVAGRALDGDDESELVVHDIGSVEMREPHIETATHRFQSGEGGVHICLARPVSGVLPQELLATRNCGLDRTRALVESPRERAQTR